MVTVTPSPLAGILQPTSVRSVDSSPSHSHSFSHSQMSRNSSRKSNNSVNCKLDGMSLCLIRDNHYKTTLRNNHTPQIIQFIYYIYKYVLVLKISHKLNLKQCIGIKPLNKYLYSTDTDRNVTKRKHFLAEFHSSTF